MKEVNEIKCAYCGKTRPLSELHKGKIIHQAFRNGRKCVVEDENYYCNGTSCHIHDQMAHEG